MPLHAIYVLYSVIWLSWSAWRNALARQFVKAPPLIQLPFHPIFPSFLCCSLIPTPSSPILTMVTPLVKPKIVKKRTKSFRRHYADRFERLNYGSWRKPKGTEQTPDHHTSHDYNETILHYQTLIPIDSIIQSIMNVVPYGFPYHSDPEEQSQSQSINQDQTQHTNMA